MSKDYQRDILGYFVCLHICIREYVELQSFAGQGGGLIAQHCFTRQAVIIYTVYVMQGVPWKHQASSQKEVLPSFILVPRMHTPGISTIDSHLEILSCHCFGCMKYRIFKVGLVMNVKVTCASSLLIGVVTSTC